MMEWIDVKDRLPDVRGRYLILTTFDLPCVSNDAIVRKNVPFVSNFIPSKGWMGTIDEQEVTHWMSIPEPPKPLES